MVFGRKDVFIKSFRFLLTFNESELGIADIDPTSDSNFDMSKYTEASEKLSVQKDTMNKAFKNESMVVTNEKPKIVSGDEQVIEIPSRAVEEPYKCSKCPDSFESTAKLSKHVKIVHSISDENSDESDYTEKSKKLDLPMSPKVAKRYKDPHLTCFT